MHFLNVRRALRLSATVLLCAALVLPLASCGEASGKKPAEFDLAAERMPFPKPEIEAQIVLPGVAALPASTQQTLTLRRAFFAGDFALLDAAMMKSHNDYLAGKGNNSEARTLIASIEDTQLAGIDSCIAWLRAMPDSYPAHWLCGAMWREGAWAARGKKFSSEVSDARFAIMRERLHRSNTLLERAITLTPKPIEVLTMLGGNHYLNGDAQQAESFLKHAERILPQHWQIYDVRLNYAQPQWGGSDAQIQTVLAQVGQASIEKSTLLDWHDRFVARPWKLSNPGAARAYWERAIREYPTRERLVQLRNDFIRLENWREALPVASRLIADYPGSAEDFYWRAWIHKGQGQLAEARADYYTAAAMGKDLALQELIMANIRGGLGVTEKSFDTALALCRYGAALGSGVGANCIGSLFFEGGSAGVPHRNDASQGLAWHLVGARAGHYNSQYDLGWLLYTGRGAGVKEEAGKNLGIFWLRRAAEQDHVFAKRKLEENGISPGEDTHSLLEDGLSVQSVVALLSAVFWKIF